MLPRSECGRADPAVGTPPASPHPSSRIRSDCRLCGSRNLTLALSLGSTPLANEFITADELGRPQEQFPLDLFFCQDCTHVQLRDVVDPERLFRHYVYVSGTSPVFVDHFRRYAEAILALTQLAPGAQVLEIGSNDGTLLRWFQNARMRVLGIDPAVEIANRATASGIETRAEFFDLALAKRLRVEGWHADLITANNVFAHADDLHGMVDAVAHLLQPDGLFVFEVSYLLDVVDCTLFDTIYHEHLSYHAVKPLVGFFARHGMELIDAVRVDTHGGSLRGIAKRTGGRHPLRTGVAERIAHEASRGLNTLDAYARLKRQIAQRRSELTHLLTQLKAAGKTVIGLGAPAKATTLMYHFGLGPETLTAIIDDSPLKQGRYSPGHHLPIVPSSRLYDPGTRPDYALILAWNFAESIIATHQRFRESGGHFIIPLPMVEVR